MSELNTENLFAKKSEKDKKSKIATKRGCENLAFFARGEFFA